ncbi:EF-P beta-lysylation protein EpmB [Coxiella endosymbiont of Amblyomma sculptum]|uniref:EF-P beta-lysylation protein EpmB n=1 Tax=Coxiella endosymbiont of Amblyomma sculptum TaxID=2487929 RepID=UPI00132F3C3B|nr:EF-P beta-lysylation protein EpmB [Coxiella endosymbiont of Amblyomma sculptum]QHG92223.1 EF-P beta-lysylation protein EpmB [Coxiella endosymbiont of Amblyomma sculptum]
MCDWQFFLKKAITNINELYQELALDPEIFLQKIPKTIADRFPLLVPRTFVDRMEKGNPQDPLLLQVLPKKRELSDYSGYRMDPLEENQSNRMPGLLHKYHGRVLLILSGSCAVHCRYCFRQYFPYKKNAPRKLGWNRVFHYLKSNTSITEVILSGGDPLMIKDKILAKFIFSLEKIPNLKRLRIHTRLPIVIPERITDEFIRLLNHTRLLPIVVFHCNHPNEIDQSVAKAFSSLRKTKAVLLNQSVLLKDVNDKAEILIRLSENLFEVGVLPYYLHVLDQVRGSAHFEVREKQIQNLITEVTNRLPGYLVPKLVKEIASAPAKVLIPAII